MIYKKRLLKMVLELVKFASLKKIK